MVSTLVVLLLCVLKPSVDGVLEAVSGGRLIAAYFGMVAEYDNDDSVYIWGGFNYRPNDKMYRYNLTSQEVVEIGWIGRSRGFGSGGKDSQGRLYHIGGRDRNEYFTDILRFDPQQSEHEVFAHMPHTIAYQASVSDNQGVIYTTGGYAYPDETGALDAIYRFNTTDPKEGVVLVGNLPEPRFSHSSVFYNGSVFLFGGDTSAGESNSILEWIPATNVSRVWDSVLFTRLSGPSAVLVGNQAFVIGGLGAAGSLHQITCVNFTTSETEFVPVLNFPHELWAPSAIYVEKHNAIYVFGGADRNSLAKNTIYKIPL